MGCLLRRTDPRNGPAMPLHVKRLAAMRDVVQHPSKALVAVVALIVFAASQWAPPPGSAAHV